MLKEGASENRNRYNTCNKDLPTLPTWSTADLLVTCGDQRQGVKGDAKRGCK